MYEQYIFINIIAFTCYSMWFLILNSSWTFAIKSHMTQKKHVQHSNDDEV